MLNDALYLALVETFGEEPEVVNSGLAAVFSCPKAKITGWNRKTAKFAVVEHWGESYRINCPRCGDTRKRLYFGHLYGMAVKVASTVYQFGKLYYCQNEHCDLRAGWLSKMKLKATDRILNLKPAEFSCFLLKEVELPKACRPLMDPEVPDTVSTYLYGRGFDLEQLANAYFCQYAPKGTVWQPAVEGGEDKILYEDRLLIPVIAGRSLVGWQLRRLVDLPKDPYKYLNSSFRKSEVLYNMDNALFERDIVICEGVTDVWRIGKNAVALFGKHCSPAQMQIMKALWGFSGSAVICLDGDARRDAELLAAQLKRDNIFPRGVGIAELPKIMDPADLERSRLLDVIEKARSHAS